MGEEIKKELTPEEKAELLTEQEYVAQSVSEKIGELNVLLAHARQVGVLIELREDMREIMGELPQQYLYVNRSLAYIGFRKKSEADDA